MKCGLYEQSRPEAGQAAGCGPARPPWKRSFRNETEGTRALLEERFALTHEVDFIPNGFVGGDLPEVLWQRNSLDQTLAVWEGRGEPTPWLIMQAKRP